jgi:hypothetical protein
MFQANGAPLGLSAATDTYTQVIYVAGGITSWYANQSAPPGTQLLYQASGPEAFLYTEKDFDGLARAEVYPAGLGANALVATDASMHVSHRLFGFTGTFDGEALAMTADTPSGARLCPCTFDSLTGSPPGDYVMHASAAGAPASALSDFYVGGADVELPQS